MCGLLYKDFIAIRGKRLTWILALSTVLYIILRICFPGTNTVGGIMDSVFCLGEFTVLWMGCSWINSAATKIVQFDKKQQIQGYLSSMPIDQKTYVASKFIFIVIAAYVFFSLYIIWHIISLSFMADNYFKDFSYLLASVAIPFVSSVLFVTATELLLYLILGNGTAKIVKEIGIMLIGILILAYLLFGDLTIIENWGIEVLIHWAETHAFFLTMLSVFFPLVVLLFCYLFYRIAAKLYHWKEDADV